MDFIDSIKLFSARVEMLKDKIATEEATKMSLIMPFFQLLGYDVFNPHEFLPEFTADVGIKKGEKVDYAVLKDDNPMILIEAKWCGDRLDRHGSQLFRYFGTTTAKFGILTNGIQYKFYTDLDEPNKMDMTPFLEIDILNIKENQAGELKKFHKDSFDIDYIFSTASELKYSKAIKEFMAKQLDIPSDDFIRFILTGIYNGVKTQNVIDKFKIIVRKSLNEFISETMNEKITSALKTDKEKDDEVKSDDSITIDVKESSNKITTTLDELEAFVTVKSIISEVIASERITYKDTESYFSILIDGNIRKWICRINFDTVKKQIYIPDENKSSSRFYIEKIDEIKNYKEQIIEVVKRYL